jgi:arylsulfatase A-like enzyme
MLVLFLSEYGSPVPRCKTALYDDGIKMPLIARWPGHITAGSRCGSLVSSLDIAPTILSLAGVKARTTLLNDPKAKVRDMVFPERNGHDYAAHCRTVRSKRFEYIRNDDQERPLTPPADAVRSPTVVTMRRLWDAGDPTSAHRSYFVSPRPSEKLYDVNADRHELTNLAADPKYADVLNGMRRGLAD